MISQVNQLGNTKKNLEKMLKKFKGLRPDQISAILPGLLNLVEAGIVSFYGYQAAERLNEGTGIHGAAVGFMADRLAHSNLPNNQVAGVGIGGILAAIGLLNLPEGDPPEEFWSWGSGIAQDPNYYGVSGYPMGPEGRAQCEAEGGIYGPQGGVCYFKKT